MPTPNRIPHLSLNWSPAGDVIITHAKGCEMFDAEGRRYLDFLSGIGVVNTGHCHPKVVQAIEEQARRLLHSQSYLAVHPPILELAEKLAEITPGAIDTFFFCNSGSEAVEAGMRLARSATGTAKYYRFSGGISWSHRRSNVTDQFQRPVSNRGLTFYAGRLLCPLPTRFPPPDKRSRGHCSLPTSLAGAFTNSNSTRTHRRNGH